MREPRIVGSGILAGEIARALRPFLDRPFALFGYSLGALLAFEVVRELRRRGAPLPVCLFMAAMRAPHLAAEHPPLSALSRDELIDRVDYYYQPSDPGWQMPELREILLPILRDDMSLVDDYRYAPEPALDCAIHAYVGAEDRGAPVRSVESWREHTTGDFTLTVFRGSHFFLHSVLSELQGEVHNRLRPYLGDGCGVG
jgi:medium-chain acyl-[acyl-carrier-protein] hydrolase